MKLRIFLLLPIFLFAAFGVVIAQQEPARTDSSGLYRKIEAFSTQRKFTNLIHGWILRPLDVVPSPSGHAADYPHHRNYTGLEGKIIRRINITTLDPFGYSVYDTSSRPHDIFSKGGNTMHVKSRHFAIRNRLLIHKNEPFDSLLLRESERLIRSQSYIHDLEVKAIAAGINSDSVDIFIRVMDLWSIIPDGYLSNERIKFELSDKNLAGLGHTFSGSLTQNYLNGGNAFSSLYYIPNIRNTYISSRVVYSVDENSDYQKSINIDRPFFSPYTLWAGGIVLSQQKKPAWINKDDTTRLFLHSKFNILDYWAAASWQLFKGKTEFNRTTKLIYSVRMYNIQYLEKPEDKPELLDYYANEVFLMSGLGISSRKYVRQYYVYRFGIPEDVPVGFSYGIVGGYQLKNKERWYWEAYHSWGNFYKWGYFGTRFEYGTFANASNATEGVLTAGINYFSGLFSIGNWKFRQFVRPQLTLGINQPSYNRLTLNDGYGIRGFNSDVLTGTRRLLLLLQTQSYAPWNVLGFRFGPYLNVALGMLGNDKQGFSRSRFYPQIGLGLLVRNDYLVIKYFQFSFAFYPSIPGNGENIFKANPFRTTDFGFTDFIIGKPDIIKFQ